MRALHEMLLGLHGGLRRIELHAAEVWDFDVVVADNGIAILVVGVEIGRISDDIRLTLAVGLVLFRRRQELLLLLLLVIYGLLSLAEHEGRRQYHLLTTTEGVCLAWLLEGARCAGGSKRSEVRRRTCLGGFACSKLRMRPPLWEVALAFHLLADKRLLLRRDDGYFHIAEE